MSFKSLIRKPDTISTLLNDFSEPWNDWFFNEKFSKALTLPSVNISEDDNSFNLKLAAPGLHKSDFKIDVAGDILTISAEKEDNKEEKDEKFTRKEYNFTSFSRSFTLPDNIEKEKISAGYENGILKLVIPKDGKVVKEAQKKIEVK